MSQVLNVMKSLMDPLEWKRLTTEWEDGRTSLRVPIVLDIISQLYQDDQPEVRSCLLS
jgi:hypothetical protein